MNKKNCMLLKSHRSLDPLKGAHASQRWSHALTAGYHRPYPQSDQEDVLRSSHQGHFRSHDCDIHKQKNAILGSGKLEVAQWR